MKSIVCTHGIEVWDPLPPLRRRALRHATLVLAPSRATADYVVSLQGVARERVRVLPWGLIRTLNRKSSASPPPRYQRKFPSGRVVLTVGRWLATERYKGMDTLMTACAFVAALAGTSTGVHRAGDDRPWLENIARDSGVGRHVHFLTGLTYGELSPAMALRNLCFASRGEGFGFVYLEAMARGKPVIGGAAWRRSEVIQDGVTGYVVPHAIRALATRSTPCFPIPEMAREMGARGRDAFTTNSALAFSQSLQEDSPRTMRILNVTQSMRRSSNLAVHP